MSVTDANLTSPVGELDPAVLFPGESAGDFTDRLDAYIRQGVIEAVALSGAEQDVAVTRWAYYRAYDAVAQRLTATAQSISLSDQGSRTYTLGQADRFQAKAAAYRALFDAGLATDSVDPGTPITRSTRNVFVW